MGAGPNVARYYDIMVDVVGCDPGRSRMDDESGPVGVGSTCILHITSDRLLLDTKHEDHHASEKDSTGRPHQLPIDSQPPESRWSKRAGLHVLHCGQPLSPSPFTRSPDSLLSSAD